MGIVSPEIDIDSIKTLEEAKQILRQVLNNFEIVLKRLDQLEKENILLRQEIARLKGQPRKPQFTSSKNKSSYNMSTVFEKDKKQWHKSIKGDIAIDQHVTLPEATTCVCGSTEFRTIKTTKKIVQGIIIKRNNTMYHGKKKQCVSCGNIYKTQIPADVHGMGFDSTLHSLVSFLKFYGRFTHPLLHTLLTGFGIQISYGEITTILKRNSKKLASVRTHLKMVGIKKSIYIQSDATGAKRKHRGTGVMIHQHLHILGNKLLSIFTITRYYNAKVMNEMLGKAGLKKTFLSDDGSPNGESCRCTNKQLCWVHEIRHYRRLFPFFNPHQKLQRQILTQWSRFYHLAKEYGRDPTEEKRKEIAEMFDTITSQTTGYDLLDKQLRLTRKKKQRLLTFLDHPYIPIHNNQCELDLREFVIQRKISGETKSVAGDRSIERHLSVIQTAKKQKLDVFKTLHGLLTGTLSPSILTANIA